MTEPVRLAKRVAALVPCSRSEAEQLIEGGWVRVDGQVIDEPQYRVGDQRIDVDPAASPRAAEPVTLLLHQPADGSANQLPALLGPQTRSADDRSAIRSVRKHFEHLTALLPLPARAEGLAVLSQDRRVIRKLTDDALAIEQEIIAQVTGTIADGGLALLCHGLVCQGRPLPPIKVSWQNENRLRFALKGIPAERVAWMCEQVGLRSVALRRIRIGRVPLAKLAPGQWRYLAPGERF